MTEPIVVLAGATGDLGTRTAKSLVEQGTVVRALTRGSRSDDRSRRLTALGVEVFPLDERDDVSVARAATGASCMVSAVSGVADVIVNRQLSLLNGAVRAGVPRFISSDFSADYTRSRPGENRNFDLRREFADRADREPIAVTSIMSGAFMDMLGAEMPIIQPRLRSVLYWGSRHQPLDFTTRDDTAAYTAAAAVDPETPRILRIAGDTVTAADIAHVMTDVTRTKYRTLRVSSVRTLRRIVPLARWIAPDKPDPTFPAWQGMQYTADMFDGAVQLTPLDNDRYPSMGWTPLRERLSGEDYPWTRAAMTV